jgi:hypothetical protein
MGHQVKTFYFKHLYLLIYDNDVNESGVLEQPTVEEVPWTLEMTSNPQKYTV